MKLSLIRKSLIELIDGFEVEINNKNQGNRSFYVVQNWPTACDTLHMLYNYKFLTASVQAIFDLGVNYQTRTKTLTIEDGTPYSDFTKLLNIIREKCKAVIDVLSSQEEKHNQLNIKLPPIKDLSELKKFIDRLNKIFEQCPIFDNELKVEFYGVESGSSWLKIIISSAVSVSITLTPVGNFMKNCFEIRKIVAETKKIDLESKLLEIELDESIRKEILEKTKKSEEEKLREICLQRASQFAPDQTEKLSEEQISRLIYTMTTTAELFNEGMEVYPSNVSSEEIKECFPVKEEYPKLIETQKLLLEEKLIENTDITI